jgi:hypothetical protein
LTLRVTAILGNNSMNGGIGGELAPGDFTCLLVDDGAASISLENMLPRGADAVQFTASRINLTSFDAGEFSGSEFVVERRATVIVPL